MTYENIDFQFGDATPKALGEADIVIKSPGISLYRDEIAQATRAGTQFTSATNLWFAEIGNKVVIAVTGTKGKSTTASVIYHCLSQLGASVELCGNIGSPVLDFVFKKDDVDIWVIELSSYQTADLHYTPQIGVLVNLFPEHIDWHKSTENYYNDKLRLFRPAKDRVTILNYLDKTTRCLTDRWEHLTYYQSKSAIHCRGNRIYDADVRLGVVDTPGLEGDHNLSNVCAAITAVKAVGFDPELALERLGSFKSLNHRQQIIGEKEGILYIDDSISTTPESTIAAVERFTDNKITLLLGGFDRRQDYAVLAEALCVRRIGTVITIPDNGPIIAAQVEKAKEKCGFGPQVVEASNLGAAVKEAKKLTPPGGIIMLSPAAPSYGHFSDFKDRGNVFKKLAGFH